MKNEQGLKEDEKRTRKGKGEKQEEEKYRVKKRKEHRERDEGERGGRVRGAEVVEVMEVNVARRTACYFFFY